MPRRPHRQLNYLWIARKQVGLAQKSVARLLGHKTTSVISEYENGRLFPSLRTALKLAAIYNKPLTDLYSPLYREVEQELAATRPKEAITVRRQGQLNI
jgi:transcriptional regulator with XRE-family HTH domain